MRRFLSLALIAAVLVVIPAGSASAVPDDSQRLRGMAGRSFAVTVENPDEIPGRPAVFPNCYPFNAQGE
jgi:hypothetical protein